MLPMARRTSLLAVLGAQLLAALADNALLIVAIALLETRQSAGWATPALRVAFYAAYVLLAPLAGRLADRVPKARLMAAVNALKCGGAVALLGGLYPLAVFAAVGLGASAYAPARYGILPEIASGPALLRANAGMEIVTIAAILAGTLLGSMLVGQALLRLACAVLAVLYALAALCTMARNMPHKPTHEQPRSGPHATTANAPASTAAANTFRAAVAALLADRPSRAAIALTSVFWAAAAVLQFVLIGWSREVLGLGLAAAALLPAALAIGMAAGSVAAARVGRVPGRGASTVLALLLGGAIVLLSALASIGVAVALMITAGMLAGALLVPLNATLQARGAALVGAGRAVAVQNFLENILSLLFLAGYGAAVLLGATSQAAMAGLGIVVIALLGGAALLAQRGAAC